jgi:hypothetical protein
MSEIRPGNIAVSAVNQYRRRDVFAYLGLRYYLQNTGARSDNWANQVATDLVLTRTSLPYFDSQHFKELNAEGKVEHRSIFIPGPNEALAETALLAECAKHPTTFSNLPCVYSYQLTEPGSRRGTFLPYSTGLKTRQAAIADACDAIPSGIVQFMDIKKFYPSIEVTIAKMAWLSASSTAALPNIFRAVGERLVDDYGRFSHQERRSILTGPMFSHLLANLIFRDLDLEFSNRIPAKYFRYVDDITLVGELRDVVMSMEIIKRRLSEIGLHLHDDESPKSIRVPCSDWQKSRNDFSEKPAGLTWFRLIGNLKRFLVLHPEERDAIQRAFQEQGIRIPIKDYSAVVRETDYAQWIARWAPRNWFRRQSKAVSVAGLTQYANRLREKLEAELRHLLDGASTLAGFERKRRIPKLRYCLARLIYLSDDETLSDLSTAVREIPELYFHSQVMATVADGNLDRLLLMGANAAQAAAQPLKASGKKATTTLTYFPKSKSQSLAVFLMNGVDVHRTMPSTEPDSDLVRFAASGADISLMKSNDAHLRELACLHGIEEKPRHAEFFMRAFDHDEALAMDAVEQLQQSES